MGIDICHILGLQAALLESMCHTPGWAPAILSGLCQVQAVTGHAKAQYLHAENSNYICWA